MIKFNFKVTKKAKPDKEGNIVIDLERTDGEGQMYIVTRDALPQSKLRKGYTYDVAFTQGKPAKENTE